MSFRLSVLVIFFLRFLSSQPHDTLLNDGIPLALSPLSPSLTPSSLENERDLDQIEWEFVPPHPIGMEELEQIGERLIQNIEQSQVDTDSERSVPLSVNEQFEQLQEQSDREISSQQNQTIEASLFVCSEVTSEPEVSESWSLNDLNAIEWNLEPGNSGSITDLEAIGNRLLNSLERDEVGDSLVEIGSTESVSKPIHSFDEGDIHLTAVPQATESSGESELSVDVSESQALTSTTLSSISSLGQDFSPTDRLEEKQSESSESIETRLANQASLSPDSMMIVTGTESTDNFSPPTASSETLDLTELSAIEWDLPPTESGTQLSDLEAIGNQLLHVLEVQETNHPLPLSPSLESNEIHSVDLPSEDISTPSPVLAPPSHNGIDGDSDGDGGQGGQGEDGESGGSCQSEEMVQEIQEEEREESEYVVLNHQDTNTETETMTVTVTVTQHEEKKDKPELSLAFSSDEQSDSASSSPIIALNTATNDHPSPVDTPLINQMESQSPLPAGESPAESPESPMNRIPFILFWGVMIGILAWCYQVISYYV